jgi:hypothetical protein
MYYRMYDHVLAADDVNLECGDLPEMRESDYSHTPCPVMKRYRAITQGSPLARS